MDAYSKKYLELELPLSLPLQFRNDATTQGTLKEKICFQNAGIRNHRQATRSSLVAGESR